MNRIFQTGLTALVICLILLGTATVGTFLFFRYGGNPRRIETLERRVEKLESREATRVRTWTEIISTSASNGVLELKGTQLQQFPVRRPGPWEPGWFSEAWIAECEPRSEILKFDEFSVMPFKEGVIVSARPHTNEPIAMKFKVIGVMR
jgi:hypothetical protein